MCIIAGWYTYRHETAGTGKSLGRFFYAVNIEEILPDVRSYPAGARVEFSGYDSKKSTIASEADDFERCTIAGW